MVNKYRNYEREKRTEDELEEELRDKTADKDKDGKELTDEEKSFKQRYSDLRSYAQKQVNEAKALAEAKDRQLTEMQAQLEAATKKQLKFPATEDEVAEWMTTYPKVANIVKSIAMKEVQSSRQEVDSRFADLKKKEDKANLDLAFALLIKKHPDFVDFRDTDEFDTWIRSQDKWAVEALYKEDITDPVKDSNAAARVLDLFKYDRANAAPKTTKKPDTRREDLETARSVRVNDVTEPVNRSGLKYTESMLAKMSNKEVETNWPEIEKCMKDMAFYDLSGGAR